MGAVQRNHSKASLRHSAACRFGRLRRHRLVHPRGRSWRAHARAVQHGTRRAIRIGHCEAQAILVAMALRDDVKFVERHYLTLDWRHAKAILRTEYRPEWADIMAALAEFRLLRSEVETPGGAKTAIAKRLDGFLLDRGWAKKRFETQVVVDGSSRDNPTHEIDCYRNRVAVEVEWNNKDPFFDRDLNNFRILFELDAVAVGVIVTRSDELQAIFDDLGRGSSYGSSTTHWSRLAPRIEGGGSGGCPVLAFGISRSLYVDETAGVARARGKR